MKNIVGQESSRPRLRRAKQELLGSIHGGRVVRSTGRKDRHSKISTAKGPRDRRVRLSATTAIQFYDVQDRLGYDRPSKAIDWLMKKAKSAIDELENSQNVQLSNQTSKKLETEQDFEFSNSDYGLHSNNFSSFFSDLHNPIHPGDQELHFSDPNSLHFGAPPEMGQTQKLVSWTPNSYPIAGKLADRPFDQCFVSQREPLQSIAPPARSFELPNVTQIGFSGGDFYGFLAAPPRIIGQTAEEEQIHAAGKSCSVLHYQD